MATLLQSNLQNPKLTKGLIDLSRKLGFQMLSIPMEYSSSKIGVAWTTPNGIFIDYDQAQERPQDIPILIAHEILHHVIKMDAAEFSAGNLNIALDYKINQFLYEVLGYDARKVQPAGLLKFQYFKLTVVEILEELAKKGHKGPPPTFYGYEATHPLLMKCAEHIKVRFADQLRGLVTEDYFAMDLEDLANYHSIDFASKRVELALTLSDFDRTFRGIWAHISLPKTAAPLVVDDFTHEDALVYCIHGQYLREAVKGDKLLGAVATKQVLQRLDTDKQYLEAAIKKIKTRIWKIANGVHPWERVSARKRQKAWKMGKERLEKLQKEIPIQVFFQDKHVVSLKDKPLGALTTSLRTKTTDKLKRSEYEDAVKIPHYNHSDPYAIRIRRVSGQVSRKVKKAKQVSDELESLFPKVEGQDEGEIPSPTPDKKKSEAPGEESQESKQAGKQANKKRFIQYETVLTNLTLLTNIMMFVKLFQTALQSSNPTRPNEDSFGQHMMLQYGNDLSNVVSSELALLNNPDTELEFYVKLANRSLLTYAPPDKKRYPVVISIDGSGSMRGVYPKVIGFTLALASLLLKERRGVVIQLFSDKLEDSLILTANSAVDISVLLKTICNPSFGGTDFDASLIGAYDVKEKMQWPHMNMIMITDGYCEVIRPQDIILRKTDKDRLVVATTAAVPKSSIFDDLFRLSIKKDVADLISVAKTVL